MRLLLAAIIALLPCVAQASHHHHHHNHHHNHHHEQRIAPPAQTVTVLPQTTYIPHPNYAWCGWWMRQHVQELYGITLGAAYNRAIEWSHFGRPAEGAAPGVIAVKRHHVMMVVSVPRAGRIVTISGNDGHAVRVRERSTRGVIAWRWPS